MRRRAFLGVIGGAAAVWPLMARAQQAAMPVIGFLHSSSLGGFVQQIAAFRQTLKEGGFVESQNIAIEFRWAEDQYQRLPGLAKELVDRRVSVIFAAGGNISAVAAKAATSTIPIVFPAVAIRWGVVSLPVSTGQAAMRRVSLRSAPNWTRSAWSCWGTPAGSQVDWGALESEPAQSRGSIERRTGRGADRGSATPRIERRR